MVDMNRADLAVIENLAPGRINVIEHRHRRNGEPDRWLRVFLLPERGMKKVQAFFSLEEIRKAIARVAENREDLGVPKPRYSMLDRIQKAINDFFARMKK